MAGLVIGDLRIPPDLSRLSIQGYQMRIHRADEQQIAQSGHTAIHKAAADAHVGGHGTPHLSERRPVPATVW